MSSNRQLHRFYGLFPTPVLNRESEEMIHDEGLLARFLGAWFDSCMAGWEKMASDAVHENLIFELMDNYVGQHVDEHGVANDAKIDDKRVSWLHRRLALETCSARRETGGGNRDREWRA